MNMLRHKLVIRFTSRPSKALALAFAALLLIGAARALAARGDPASVQNGPTARDDDEKHAEVHPGHVHGSHAGHRAHPTSRGEQVDPTALEGLHIPDAVLLDQDGNERRFYTDLVQDNVVAMNFIFTTCTTICPPMGANFARLQELLGTKAGGEVRLISVSVDPVTDTPERLKAWGARFGAGPGWTLLTGHKHEVDCVLKSLQVFTPDFSDHSPILLIGNEPAGKWMRAYGLASPEQLVEIIEEMAASSTPSAPHAPAAEAPR